MKIKTYEIERESTEIGQLAADGEARELCEKLGLSGQLSLADNESETPFPYRLMTKIEQRVFEFHCPMKTKLSDYKGDLIPLRVLQVAAHARETEFLHEIYVWHPENARLDPVLVGNKSVYGGDLYLLARWGEVWKDFEQLTAEAITGFKLIRKAKLEKASREVTSMLEGVDSEVAAYFAGGELETFICI